MPTTIERTKGSAKYLPRFATIRELIEPWATWEQLQTFDKCVGYITGQQTITDDDWLDCISLAQSIADRIKTYDPRNLDADLTKFDGPDGDRLALNIVGGLSNPSKMPGRSYGIPAHACRVGSRLREHKGSDCNSCYALAKQSFYGMSTVRRAMLSRILSLIDPMWVPAFVHILTRSKDARRGEHAHHRWHDSGDLQSRAHLENIGIICAQSPNTSHWLPTREKRIVSGYVPPSNLVIRASTGMIGKAPISGAAHASMIARGPDEVPTGAHPCPAYQQGGSCGDCRACWSPVVSLVVYPLHAGKYHARLS
jgi:hypothetical protein